MENGIFFQIILPFRRSFASFFSHSLSQIGHLFIDMFCNLESSVCLLSPLYPLYYFPNHFLSLCYFSLSASFLPSLNQYSHLLYLHLSFSSIPMLFLSSYFGFLWAYDDDHQKHVCPLRKNRA